MPHDYDVGDRPFACLNVEVYIAEFYFLSFKFVSSLPYSKKGIVEKKENLKAHKAFYFSFVCYG